MALRQGPRVRLSLPVLLLAVAAWLAWTGTAVAANGTIQVFKGGDRLEADTNRGYAANVQGAFFEYTTDAAKAADPSSTGWTSFGPTNASGAATVSVPESTTQIPAYYVREAAVPVGFVAFGPVKALSFSDDTDAPVGTAPYAARVRVEPGETTNVTPNQNRTANPVNWDLIDPDTAGAGSPFVNVRDNTSFPETCGVDVLLVLDRSGSIDPFRTAYRDAAQAFVSSLAGTPTSMGMISFAATTATYADGTADNREQSPLSLLVSGNVTTLNTAIANVYAAPSGGTNWDSALESAANAKGFPAAEHPSGNPDVVVFITDGNPTVRTGNSSSAVVDLLDLTFGMASANLVKSQVARAGKQVKMYALGVGTGINADNLKVVSGPTAGEDYDASSIEGLRAKLAELSARLCGARVYVRKKLTGSDAEQPNWGFSGSRTGTGTISYLDNNPRTHQSTANIQTGVIVPNVAAAGERVTVAEDATGQPLTDFALSNVTCRAGGFDTGAIVTPVATSSLGVTLNAQRGSTSYCTFTNAPREPDLTISKTPDSQSIDAGQNAVFSITVSNTGTAIARGVTLQDPLPAGGTWTENSADCSIAGGTMSCSFGDLAPGASRTVQLTSPTSYTQCETYDNTATVSAANHPSRSDSGRITCRRPEVSVTKTADAPSATAGDQIGFTVTLRNTGTGTAQGVQFTDALPGGLSWAISPASAGWSIQGGNLVYAPATLAPGATSTVHVVATTAAANCGQVNNTATVTSTNGGSGTSSASVDVNCAAIDVQKTADAADVTAGDQIGFTVTLRNTGVGQARGIQFTDVLPSGLTWALAQPSAGWSIQGQNLVFAPTTLAGGASTSVHVVATTDGTDCGQVDNTASVTTANDGSDSDTASVDVLCADIDVDKTADATSASAGDPIGFTVTLRNTGDGQARGVQFTDALPPGLDWEINPAADGWSIAGGNLVFAPSTLAPGAVTSVHVRAVTDAQDCGQVDNTATLTTSNDGSDSATASVDVNCAAIDVTKTADDDSVVTGDQLGFTVTLSNTGEGEAKGIQFTDVLPTGFDWSIAAPSAGWSIQGPNLVFAPDTLAAGASTSVHVVATAVAGVCGEVFNTAAVTTTNDGSDSDTATVDVNCADIDVDKTADADAVSAGDPVGFTVTLRNLGEGEARGIQFTDALPAGLDWEIDPASDGWSIAGGALVFAPDTLAAGAVTTVHVTAATGAQDCGQIDNTATVTTTNDGSDSATASTDVNCAAVNVSKEADAADVVAGDQIGFTVTLANTGAGVARDVVFTDVLPSGFAWSISPASAGWSIQGQNLVFAPTTLAAGASTSVHVAAATDAGDCGLAENTATIASNVGGDSDTATVDVRCADVDVDKVADADAVSAGDPIGFTVTLRNTGAGEARGVELTDALPAGFDWVIDPEADGWSIADGALVFAPTTLAPEAVTAVHVRAATDAQDCGQVDNTATVTTANDGSDSASASVDVNCAAIDVTKTADDDSVVAGDQIGFTVTLSNTGEGEAKGVEFTDVLPVGLDWAIDPEAEGWSIEGPNLVFAPSTLAAGASTTVHVVATTDAEHCGEVENTASATTSNDGSDSDSATVDVNCGAIDVDKTADAPSASAGDQIGFTVTLRNTGDGEARGIEFTDVLPAGLSWSIPEPVTGWAIQGGNLVFTPSTLAAGAVTAVHVVATTDATDCGQVDNTASVTTANAGSDSADASLDVNCAAIDVSKVADEDTISAGDQIGFTVTLRNTGPGEARGIEFTDVLPAGLDWVIAPESAGWSIAGSSLVFAPTTLAGNSATTVHVIAPTNGGDCGDVRNTAAVTTTNDGSDSDSASVDVLCADIDVDKVADAGSAVAGDDIGFTVTIRNTGAGQARGLQVTDALPAGLDWTIDPASSGWSIDGGNLVYAPTTLAGGTSTSVHVTATTGADDCGPIENTASATTSNDGSGTATASVDVACPDIDVEKVADADSISAGEPIGFTVTLRNLGEGEARGIEFTDVLPDGFDWAIDPASDGWSIAGGELVFAPTTLAAGASTSVHVVATSDAEDCRLVENTASVTAANDGDAADTAVVDVNCPEITVVKTADAAEVTAGEQIGFTVTLGNTGEGRATGVEFTDVLPGGFDWAISPEVEGWSISGGELVFAPTTLEAGASTTVHVVATADGEVCGTVANTASALAANDGSGSSTATVAVLCGDIALEKVADAAAVSAGSPIGFTLTARNGGTGEARGVVVEDTLPAKSGLSWSVSPAVQGCAIAAGKLTCDFDAIAGGASRSVHVTSPTSGASCGAVDNTGTVTTTNDGSATASASTFVRCAAIAVEKSGPATVYHGDQATFTFRVTNPGNVPLTDVTVSDDKCAPVTGPTAKAGGNQDQALDPGETWTYTCTKTIESHRGGEANPVVNTVTATGTGPGGEEPSDEDTHSTAVLHPAIDIETTGPASATVGDVLDYTLTVTNPGDVPFPAQNVVVTDPRCFESPVLQTKGADPTPGSLDHGDRWTYACSADTRGQPTGTFVNRATVTGTDGNGRRVSDVDDFPTDLAAQQVIPGNVVKGTARLSGPSGCVKKAFDATVRGRRIAKVTFYVDGRKVATRKARAGQRTFRYTVRPNGLSRGVHRVTARVRFVPASETKARTLRLAFQRCKRQVVTPRFTG
jgi:uncharacterized repeat protein (TIGR01451 family)